MATATKPRSKGETLKMIAEKTKLPRKQVVAVFEELGADPDRVRPVGTAAVPRPARRPVFSALSMAESVRAGLTPLRPWREALAEAVAVPIQQ